ncbi:hypothetical protein ANO11243_036330 [Dothideomycetidae sp. 11243]|nr:hypothetical protein ANO11243_036330 [fungal sp. No.11243]
MFGGGVKFGTDCWTDVRRQKQTALLLGLDGPTVVQQLQGIKSRLKNDEAIWHMADQPVAREFQISERPFIVLRHIAEAEADTPDVQASARPDTMAGSCRQAARCHDQRWGCKGTAASSTTIGDSGRVPGEQWRACGARCDPWWRVGGIGRGRRRRGRARGRWKQGGAIFAGLRDLVVWPLSLSLSLLMLSLCLRCSALVLVRVHCCMAPFISMLACRRESVSMETWRVLASCKSIPVVVEQRGM